MTTRRNLLAIMGLASTGALVNTETMATNYSDLRTDIPGLAKHGREFQLRFAAALEALAAGIRREEVAVVKFDTHSAFTVDDWLKHDIHIEVELVGPEATS